MIFMLFFCTCKKNDNDATEEKYENKVIGVVVVAIIIVSLETIYITFFLCLISLSHLLLFIEGTRNFLGVDIQTKYNKKQIEN